MLRFLCILIPCSFPPKFCETQTLLLGFLIPSTDAGLDANAVVLPSQLTARTGKNG